MVNTLRRIVRMIYSVNGQLCSGKSETESPEIRRVLCPWLLTHAENSLSLCVDGFQNGRLVKLVYFWSRAWLAKRADRPGAV